MYDHNIPSSRYFTHIMNLPVCILRPPGQLAGQMAGMQLGPPGGPPGRKTAKTTLHVSRKSLFLRSHEAYGSPWNGKPPTPTWSSWWFTWTSWWSPGWFSWTLSPNGPTFSHGPPVTAVWWASETSRATQQCPSTEWSEWLWPHFPSKWAE